MPGVLLTAAPVRLGWRSGFTATPDGDVVVVADATHVVRVGNASPLRRALLGPLGAPDGAPLEQLLGDVAAATGDGAMAQIEARSLLNALARRGLLGTRLVDEEGIAATVATPLLPDEPVAAPAAAALSADVLIRRTRADLILESATDPARRDPITARFAGALLADALPPGWRSVLLQAGILVAAGAPEDERWEFHDRLFHTRSRLWQGPVRPYGPTMRLAGRMDPLPARHVPATATGPAIPLATHDPGRPEPPLATVAERRRSRRRPTAPLPADRLGELLHRVARVRAVRPSPAGDELDRPAPSGGALGAIGIYPLVVGCDGLAPGLYHYEGGEHALRAVEAARPDDLDVLVTDARQAAGLDPGAAVQVLLLLAARFGRLQYKYSGMAYAAALKDVGVLYQALYLTATALGLGGCALGGGDALAFERATGIDRWDEGSVGEFLLVGMEDTHGDAGTP